MREKRKIEVSLLSPDSGYNWKRQLPGCGLNPKVVFHIGDLPERADWLFVYEGIDSIIQTTIPKDRRIFICGEPRSIKKYSRNFLAQFGTVWTTQRDLDHPRTVQKHPCSPWHVGAYVNPLVLGGKFMTVDEILAAPSKKSRLISVVSSNKVATDGHRKRLQFVRLLKEKYGEEVEVFGRGIRGFNDKWEVLAEYKYHIALENCATEHYWTEKLADPILTLTYPIYFGCPDVHDYFSRDVIQTIDIERPDESIRRINSVITGNFYERHCESLARARQKLISEYNLFSEIVSYIARDTDQDLSAVVAKVKLYPEHNFDRIGRMIRAARQRLLPK